jgi:hypothetical protein
MRQDMVLPWRWQLFHILSYGHKEHQTERKERMIPVLPYEL